MNKYIKILSVAVLGLLMTNCAGNYKIKMAATTATDLVGQGVTSGTSGYIWSNGIYSVITIVVIADGKYVMTGDRSNSAS